MTPKLIERYPDVAANDESPVVMLIEDAPRRAREPSKFLGAVRSGIKFVSIWTGRLILLAIAAAYPAAIIYSNKIGDNPIDLPRASLWSDQSIGVSATLLEREVQEHGWAPSAAVWHPQARLSAMPAYQKGMASALSDYALLLASLSVQSGAPDEDLAAAARLMRLPETENADDRLMAAIEAYKRFDGRVARGLVSNVSPLERLQAEQALFTQWAEKIETSLHAHALAPTGIDFGGAETAAFYQAKGQAFVAQMLIGAQMRSYPDQIAELGLSARFERAETDWSRIAKQRPILVSNGAPDGFLVTNHMMSLSFLTAEAHQTSTELADRMLIMLTEQSALAPTAAIQPPLSPS